MCIRDSSDRRQGQVRPASLWASTHARARTSPEQSSSDGRPGRCQEPDGDGREQREISLIKYLCIPCDSNRSISIDSGAAGVYPPCLPRLCRAAPSAKRGYSAIVMTMRAEWPTDRSKGGPSVNCWTNFRSHCWDRWPSVFADFHCC